MNTWQGEYSLKDCRQEQEIYFGIIIVMPSVCLKLLGKKSVGSEERIAVAINGPIQS